MKKLDAELEEEACGARGQPTVKTPLPAHREQGVRSPPSEYRETNMFPEHLLHVKCTEEAYTEGLPP